MDQLQHLSSQPASDVGRTRRNVTSPLPNAPPAQKVLHRASLLTPLLATDIVVNSSKICNKDWKSCRHRRIDVSPSHRQHRSLLHLQFHRRFRETPLPAMAAALSELDSFRSNSNRLISIACSIVSRQMQVQRKQEQKF